VSDRAVWRCARAGCVGLRRPWRLAGDSLRLQNHIRRNPLGVLRQDEQGPARGVHDSSCEGPGGHIPGPRKGECLNVWPVLLVLILSSYPSSCADAGTPQFFEDECGEYKYLVTCVAQKPALFLMDHIILWSPAD
jgi:hypothetical protein